MGELRRSLGLGSLSFYGVGLILGAGIFSILGEAAGIAGKPCGCRSSWGALPRS